MKKTWMNCLLCVLAALACVRVAGAADGAPGGTVPGARYSKLAIVRAVKAMGKMEAVNAWIEAAGYRDEWLACRYFSDDYPGFAAITNAVVAAGVATGAEIAAVLAAAADTTEPDAWLAARYAREMRSQAGRVQWHGAVTNRLADPAARTITDFHESGFAWVNRYSQAQYDAAMESSRAARQIWHGKMTLFTVDTNALVYAETYADGWVYTAPWVTVTAEDSVELANAKRLKAAALAQTSGVPARLATARARRAEEAARRVTVTLDLSPGTTPGANVSTNGLAGAGP